MSLLISQVSCDSELENRVKVRWCCDLDYNVLLGCPKNKHRLHRLFKVTSDMQVFQHE